MLITSYKLSETFLLAFFRVKHQVLQVAPSNPEIPCDAKLVLWVLQEIRD